jgi:uncharacterized protein YlzI (FlbEa/FlbD family)
MGFSISWIAIHGKRKEDILAELSLKYLVEPGEENKTLMSGAKLPGDWYIIYFNKFQHLLAAEESLLRLSNGCKVVVCQIEEHVMESQVRMYEMGKKVWEVIHRAELGARHLSESGEFPVSYFELKARMVAEQNRNDDEGDCVDFIWEIPVSMGYEVTGYRHDDLCLKNGEQAFIY